MGPHDELMQLVAWASPSRWRVFWNLFSYLQSVCPRKTHSLSLWLSVFTCQVKVVEPTCEAVEEILNVRSVSVWEVEDSPWHGGRARVTRSQLLTPGCPNSLCPQ